MNQRAVIFLIVLWTGTSAFAQSTARMVLDFNKHWKFLLNNDSAVINPSYDDSKWRLLDLPHDWSIEGSFSEANPSTSQGGALPGGIGWYRKSFVLPASSKNKNVRIE